MSTGLSARWHLNASPHNPCLFFIILSASQCICLFKGSGNIQSSLEPPTPCLCFLQGTRFRSRLISSHYLLPRLYLDLRTWQSLFLCLLQEKKKNRNKVQSQFRWTHTHTHTCLSLALVSLCRNDLVSKLEAHVCVNHYPGCIMLRFYKTRALLI